MLLLLNFCVALTVVVLFGLLCGIKCEGGNHESGFDVKPDASILDYLNPNLFEKNKLLEMIGEHLQAGNVVVIRDAFLSEFADYVYSDLARPEIEWQHYEDYSPNFGYSHHNIYIRNKFTRVMNETHAIFDHPKSKDFLGNLSGRDCSGESISASPSKYYPGDYSMPHTDFQGQRSVAFIWHLSYNWDPAWGGHLYWVPEQKTNALLRPSYNTLILFSVTVQSNHFVAPVSRHAKEPRLAFNGWWEASGMPTMDDSTLIEERYITLEQQRQLTRRQSDEILKIDLHYIEDLSRREMIAKLQGELMVERIPPRTTSCIVYPEEKEASVAAYR